MPTLQEMTDEVLSHQFSRLQYGDYAKSQINKAQDHVTAQTDFRELEAAQGILTVASEPIYELPEDFQRNYTLLVSNPDGSKTPLVEIDRYTIDKQPVAAGIPTQYALDGTNLRLWPSPDKQYVLTLRYYRKPTELDAPNDEPDIPGEYAHLLVSYTLWHCFERENDYNAAQYHKARFDEDIMKCRGEVQYDHDDYSQPKQVGSASFDTQRGPYWGG